MRFQQMIQLKSSFSRCGTGPSSDVFVGALVSGCAHVSFHIVGRLFFFHTLVNDFSVVDDLPLISIFVFRAHVETLTYVFSACPRGHTSVGAFSLGPRHDADLCSSLSLYLFYPFAETFLVIRLRRTELHPHS